MEQILMNCEHKFKESCPNFYHPNMQSIIKKMDEKPNAAGFIPNSEYEIADKLCKECTSFKLNRHSP